MNVTSYVVSEYHTETQTVHLSSVILYHRRIKNTHRRIFSVYTRIYVSIYINSTIFHHNYSIYVIWSLWNTCKLKIYDAGYPSFSTYTHLYLQTCLHVKVVAFPNFNWSIGIINFLIKMRTHARVCKDEFVSRRQCKTRYPSSCFYSKWRTRWGKKD
jgi:hypothetical protein